MKIPFVKFNKHPILGDIDLDFRKNRAEKVSICREDDPKKNDKTMLVPTPQKGNQYSIILNQDNIYDYILFVGENGDGKTTILRELNDYNNSRFVDYAFDKFNVELYSQLTGQKFFGFPNHFASNFLERDMKYNEGRIDERSEIFKSEMEMRDHVSGDMHSWLNICGLSADTLKRIFGNERLASAYAEAGKFQVPHSMRATTYAEMRGKPDTMIDYIKDLSSGEQEILLRLLYFFKHPLSQCSDSVLIDEPEAGLHPKWQLKILEFYKEIFKNQEDAGWIKPDGAKLTPLVGKQKLQIFIASHSENILKSAIEQQDWLIIRLFRDGKGEIVSERIEGSGRRLPALTFAETQYIVFGLPSRDYHNESYGCLQNKIGKTTVKGFDSWIVGQAEYQASVHERPSTNAKGVIAYQTICSYVRNEIDHPPTGGITFSEEQLRISIELLRAISKSEVVRE